MEKELKRLFFGMEAIAPWPEEFPPGRVLLEQDRHLTLAFLGDADLSKLLEALSQFPKPSFSIGLAGIFDQMLFLPVRSPRVVAWHVHFLEHRDEFLGFQKSLIEWLKNQGFDLGREKNEFLAHMTIARNPFAIREWKEAFRKLPLYVKNIHLCESLGHSKYKILWTHPILAPFDSIEHTADIAFRIYGMDLSNLYLHAQLAMCFHFPPFIDYLDQHKMENLEQIVASMNQRVAKADMELGCPFKAVSFHGEITDKGTHLEWEMIVDV